MRNPVRRFIRWIDNHTLLAFNPGVQFRQQTPKD
jgi:hypothetical protein